MSTRKMTSVSTADSRSSDGRVGDWSRTLLVVLLLSLATLLAYMAAVDNGFVFDDAVYVSENEHLADGLTVSALGWALGTGYASNWHPLTWVSHLIDVELFGLDPAGHHLSGLLLHLASTLLLFFVLRSMTRTTWRSGLVAALFAVHPLHVESVAWISERKDVLSAFFWFLTMAAYTIYVRQGGVLRYTLVVLCFALGLMAKQMLVTLPFALLLFDVWPLERLSYRRGSGFGPELRARLIEKIPLFLLTLAATVATFIAQNRAGAVGDLTRFPVGDRLANAVVSYVAYLGKLLWPVDLAAFYPYRFTLPLWQVGGALVILVVITALALRVVDRRPYVPVGWLFYLGTLVPVIGLVQLGEQAMADRYTYIPAVGIFILASWWSHDIARRAAGLKIAISVSWAVALVLLTQTTFIQVTRWHDNVALFTHALQVTRDNYFAHDILGFELVSRQRLEDAVPHFTAALQSRPDHAMSHNNLGRALISLGEFPGAVSHLRQAVASSPEVSAFHLNLAFALTGEGHLDAAREEFAAAVRLNPDAAASGLGFERALAHFGAILLRGQQYPAATAILSRVVAMSRDMPDAEVSLAHALLAQGQVAEAEIHYRRAVELQPDPAADYFGYGKNLAPQAHFGLASTLAARGELVAAEAQYREALRLSPAFAAATTGLAWLLATADDDRVYAPDEALALATTASRFSLGRDPRALDALAAALAGRGEFVAAVHYGRLAREAARGANRERLVESIEVRISRYEAGQTYRQGAINLAE